MAIDEEQAIALATTYLTSKRSETERGPFTSVRHRGPKLASEKTGTYYVEFAYVGPPVKVRTTPPRDHPTVVLVDDQSGACSFMMWM